MNFKKAFKQVMVALLSFLIAGGPALAARTTTYFHNDGAGSVVAATNEAGAVLWRKDYAPFGAQLNTPPNAERTSYTGKQHDEEIGLTYFGARWFDPELARFTGVDPVGFIHTNTMSFNRYLYGFNNPYKFADPDGQWAFLIAILIGLAASDAANAPSKTDDHEPIGGATRFAAGAWGPGLIVRGAAARGTVTERVADRELMGACFAAGTPIQTERGILPIEEVRVDDRIWSRNEVTGEEDYRRVIHTFVTPEQPTLVLRVTGGGGATETIETTEEHPFWVNGRGWTAARELQSGDAIFSSRESSARVVSTSWTYRTTFVYNFEVEEFHTYFVGNAGLWVHNVSRLNMDAAKASKVDKSTKTEQIGKFTKTTEVRPGRGPGQSRAEYVRYKNEKGEVIRTHKDSYDRAGNFQNRKPLRGGPEGRPAGEP